MRQDNRNGVGISVIMPIFVLLIFGWDDDVQAIKNVRGADLGAAVRLAETIITAHPDVAGYQLWLNGRRVYATFPAGTLPRRPWLDVIAAEVSLQRKH